MSYEEFKWWFREMGYPAHLFFEVWEDGKSQVYAVENTPEGYETYLHTKQVKP